MDDLGTFIRRFVVMTMGLAIDKKLGFHKKFPTYKLMCAVEVILIRLKQGYRNEHISSDGAGLRLIWRTDDRCLIERIDLDSAGTYLINVSNQLREDITLNPA